MLASLDKNLIKLLGEDARQSSEELAKQLGISSITVRRRLAKLLKDGSLRIIGVVDPVKAGLPLAVVITLDVDQDKIQSAIDFLSELPEIHWVSPTTGRFDIIAYSRFSSTSHLTNFMLKELTKIVGLKNSEAFICLDNLDTIRRLYMPGSHIKLDFQH